MKYKKYYLTSSNRLFAIYTLILSLIILPPMISCYQVYGQGNIVYGIFNSDEIWEDTVRVVGDVIFEMDATLTIKPGSTILIAANRDTANLRDAWWDLLSGINQGDSAIDGVHPGEPFRDELNHISLTIGKLVAIGSPDSLITIKSDSENPGIYDWNFFNFNEGVLSYCQIENYRCLEPGPNSVINHCTLTNIGEAGIGVYFNTIIENNIISYANHELIDMHYSPGLIIRNNVLGPNPGFVGIIIDGGNSQITSNSITGCLAGIFFIAPSNTYFNSNELRGNVSNIGFEYDPDQPIADFGVDSTYGNYPLSVDFYNKSLGIISDFEWDFGDGEYSAIRNPTHTYEVADTFSVSLTVLGPGGTNTKIIRDYINVNNPTSINDEPTDWQWSESSILTNYPNPFSYQTNIPFELIKSANVSLRIFNINGKLIRSLIRGKELNIGKHKITWDGTNEQNQPVSSGVYIYQIQIENFSQTKKCMLIR